MRYDYHVHSTYSDGSAMAAMLEAAREAGLEGVGFADHCNVSAEEPGRSAPHTLDETYPERREEIEEIRGEYDLEVFDAVELDYRPEDEERIEALLTEADFDFAIGSVHHVGVEQVAKPAGFADEAVEDRALFVDRYYDLLVEMIGSELFDVAGHVDLTERNPHLQGLGTEEHYRDVARAFAASRPVHDLNAGRVFRGPREIHPRPEFIDVLDGEGVAFTTGTDSHAPEEIGERADYIAEVAEERDLEIVDPV